MVFQTQVSLGLIWVSHGSALPALFLPCFSPAKSTQDGGPHSRHLGKQQQRAAGLGICVLVPEVKQLWGEDGRCEEPQEEKATYGQALHILPREAAGERSLPKPTSQLGKWRRQGLPTLVRHGEVRWERGREAVLACQEGFSSLGLSFCTWKIL